MMDTVDAAKVLIKEKCDEPFVYVRKTYSTSKSWQSFNNNHKRDYGSVQNYWDEEEEYYQNLLDGPSEYHDEPLAKVAMSDNELELEVTIYGRDLKENSLIVTGETKAECWKNLFIENPNLCFNDIIDYTWG